VYIEVAKVFYNYPFLFYDKVPALEYKKNQLKAHKLIKESIEEAIRKMLPLQLILKKYLGIMSEINDTKYIKPLVNTESNNNQYQLINNNQQQPQNNIVRVAIQTMAAVLGGTQSLHTNGFDEALSLPTEQAAGIALKTQQIVAHESGITQTVDPLAGSYFVEQLTNDIETAANELIAKIDAMGGAVKAIEQGYIQEEIAKSAYAYNKAIEDGSKIIVGVNKFTNKEVNDTPLLKIDDSIREKQSEKLRALRAKRDATKAAASIQKIKDAAQSDTNLMPIVIEAVENLCTLGEISDALRSIWGEYKG
jgi:methylmalonyl-CoA mutase N-terminal domain/subunit